MRKIFKILLFLGLIIIFTLGFISLVNLNSLETNDIIKYNNKTNVLNKEIRPIQEAIQIPDPKSGDIIGRIIIESINVNLPIIEDVTEENFKNGAAHISNTSLPWNKGNCFISAHRSWTKGKLFNRLNEINTNEIIKLVINDKTYEYIVYDIQIVKPNNTKVFYQQKGEYDLTLTTCTPLYKATYRLIIFCTRKEI
ncbi:MAG: class D sortase [Bacilli bacterium]